MTLNDSIESIIYKVHLLETKQDKISYKELRKEIKSLVLEYARSIIPAKQEACNLNDNCNICQQRIGFNACRTQMLSRIEEDSK